MKRLLTLICVLSVVLTACVSDTDIINNGTIKNFGGNGIYADSPYGVREVMHDFFHTWSEIVICYADGSRSEIDFTFMNMSSVMRCFPKYEVSMDGSKMAVLVKDPGTLYLRRRLK